jgi:hypothetical protein
MAEPLAFSTVFSTVVEILGKKPKHLCGITAFIAERLGL